MIIKAIKVDNIRDNAVTPDVSQHLSILGMVKKSILRMLVLAWGADRRRKILGAFSQERIT